jgi:hypothetical protein
MDLKVSGVVDLIAETTKAAVGDANAPPGLFTAIQNQLGL